MVARIEISYLTHLSFVYAVHSGLKKVLSDGSPLACLNIVGGINGIFIVFKEPNGAFQPRLCLRVLNRVQSLDNFGLLSLLNL